jgi:hypothetical protein
MPRLITGACFLTSSFFTTRMAPVIYSSAPGRTFLKFVEIVPTHHV